MIIDFDLENNPLLIKSDSIIGSKDRVKIKFLTAQDEQAGGLTIRLLSNPVYWLWECSDSFTNFPTDFPSETDKILKIEKLSGSDYKRFVLLCNSVELLNVLLSDSNCKGETNWRTYWNRNVARIQFDTADSVSDFYQQPSFSLSKH